MYLNHNVRLFIMLQYDPFPHTSPQLLIHHISTQYFLSKFIISKTSFFNNNHSFSNQQVGYLAILSHGLHDIWTIPYRDWQMNVIVHPNGLQSIQYFHLPFIKSYAKTVFARFFFLLWISRLNRTCVLDRHSQKSEPVWLQIKQTKIVFFYGGFLYIWLASLWT